MLSNFSSMASKSIMNSIIGTGCFDDSLDSMTFFKMLDNVSTLGLIKGDYKGSTIGLLSFSKDVHESYGDNFGLILSNKSELMRRDVLTNFITSNDLNGEAIEEEYDLGLNEEISQEDMPVKLDIKDSSRSMKKYNFEVSSYEGISFSVVMIDQSKVKKEKNKEEFGIEFYFDTGNMSVTRQFAAMGKKMWLKWSHIREAFPVPNDTIEMSILKLISRHSLPRIMRRIDLMLEKLTSCRDTGEYTELMEKIDGISAVAIELSNIMMARPLYNYNSEKLGHYKDFFDLAIEGLIKKTGMRLLELKYINNFGKKQRTKLSEFVKSELEESHKTHSVLVDHFEDVNHVIKQYGNNIVSEETESDSEDDSIIDEYY
jgi:hypothetical protein